MSILYISVKSKLSDVKKKFSKQFEEKRRLLIEKTEPYKNEVIAQLRMLGYKRIRVYSLSTWKYYGKNQIRLTFLATLYGKKYVIKTTRGFENKILNSIRFQNMFNDSFDFIPKGFEIKMDGYVGYATEFIPSYPFSWATYFINNHNAEYYIAQVNRILDELNRFKIVHCDLESVNVLVSKGRDDHKIYIIDWDTSCSEIVGLHCDHFPGYTIKRPLEDGRYLYDDAFSFTCLFKRCKINSLDELGSFKELVGKIGRNIHISDE